MSSKSATFYYPFALVSFYRRQREVILLPAFVWLSVRLFVMLLEKLLADFDEIVQVTTG